MDILDYNGYREIPADIKLIIIKLKFNSLEFIWYLLKKINLTKDHNYDLPSLSLGYQEFRKL